VFRDPTYLPPSKYPYHADCGFWDHRSLAEPVLQMGKKGISHSAVGPFPNSKLDFRSGHVILGLHVFVTDVRTCPRSLYRHVRSVLDVRLFRMLSYVS